MRKVIEEGYTIQLAEGRMLQAEVAACAKAKGGEGPEEAHLWISKESNVAGWSE